MTSTTTCNYSQPKKTEAGGMLAATDAANNNFAFASSSCVTVSDQGVIGGFTYGEAVTGFFILIILIMHFFGGVLNRLTGVKLKRYVGK